MAAPVRIEAEAFTDPRFDILGQLLGTDRYGALGVMAHIWSWATEREVYEIPISIASVFVGLDRARVGHIVTADLAELVPPPADAIRIRGSRGRFEWLGELREMRRAGGKARVANAVRNEKGQLVSTSTTSKLDQPRGTSTTSKRPAPSSALTPTSASALSPDPEQRDHVTPQENASVVPPKGRRASPIPDGWVPSRLEGNIRAEAEAKAAGVVLRTELESMRDWAKSQGKTRKDWDAQWRNWLRESTRRARGRPTANPARTGISQTLLSIARGEVP